MAASAQEFSELQIFWTALRDVDKIRERTEKEGKIDDVLHALQDVSLDSFDEQSTDVILNGVREALSVLYMNKLRKINHCVYLTSEDLVKFENSDERSKIDLDERNSSNQMSSSSEEEETVLE